MSEVSGSIPVSGLCFLLIFVVFTLCLPCYSSLLSACKVKRFAPSMVLKVARFPGMSEVSGSIPVSGHCFLLIFVVFKLCLPCYSSLLSACKVKRGAPSMVLKVARFPGMSEVSGSIPVSGHCFLLIFVVFKLCLPCYSPLLSACTVKRGAPSTV